MNEAHGQRWEIEQWHDLRRLKLARAEIRAMNNGAFDRYESPFEAKLTLRDKSSREYESHSVNAWSSIMAELESNDWVEHVSQVFGVPLVADRWRHYAGVFRYLPGDHLGVHVDAGIHPISGLRKHVTLVLYFGAGAGPLELWAGSSCSPQPERIPIGTFGQWYPGETPEPAVTDGITRVEPGLGTIVMFECNDYAWHSAEPNDSDEDRIVMTVSYLSAQVDAFANRRTDPERYAEAYRG